MTTVLENTLLLPESWRSPAALATVRAFNPGLLRDGDGWLLACRIVAEPGFTRRIALCRLNASFQVIEGSQVPLSEHIRLPQPETYAPEASTWFADPRLYRLLGRLFVYWNSGWHEPRNHQFLQELDPATLAPIGIPRELLLAGARQKLEKNWTFFEATDDAGPAVFAVYSVNPHRVLRVPLDGAGAIECADAWAPIPNRGGFAQLHGGLRGGSPPQRHGDHFYSFCHSIENGADGYRYVASAYRFSARPPFRPTDMPHRPLAIDIPASGRRALPKLNPAVSDVIYPAGAACCGGKWAVSCGIDDERCAIARLDEADVLATLAPVG